jgi:hypothetical protein
VSRSNSLASCSSTCPSLPLATPPAPHSRAVGGLNDVISVPALAVVRIWQARDAKSDLGKKRPEWMRRGAKRC